MSMDNSIYFQRTALVAGSEMMKILPQISVLIFGVGGVGSWCVEALARTGIGKITIVDPDDVAPSNINRQLPAIQSTIGTPKVEALAQRLRQINPDAEINAVQGVFSAETEKEYDFGKYDYVIDAIDSLPDKALLILKATDPASQPHRAFFSSMGAARKISPEKIAVAEFWKVQGCPLARALRNRFKKNDTYPKQKFKCVYSPETIPSHNINGVEQAVNGTFAHITGIFGLTLASLVVKDLYSHTNTKQQQ